MPRHAVPFLSLLLCATPLIAAETRTEREELTVLGRRVNLVGHAVSASEGLVSQEELSRRPMLRTGEILETVPGLIATQHSGSGKANQYFLRGFNLDHGTDFAAWVDHMPVNLRSHGHGQGYTDLNFVIPELVRQIAYRKGAYYADVGDFSGAGTATITSFDRLPEGRLSLTAGHDDFYRVLAMDSLQAGSGDLLYAVESTHYQGPWTDIGEDLSRTSAVIRYSSEQGSSRWSVQLMAYDSYWNAADQIPLRAVRGGLIRELGSIDPDAGGESSRYSLSLGWSRNGWEAHAYAIRYQMRLWSNFTYFLDDPVYGDEFEQQDRRWIWGGDLNYRWEDRLGSLPLTGRIGLETRYDDIGAVGLHRTEGRRRLGTVRSDRIDEASAALFAQTTAHWSRHFRAVLGLRYDHYHFSVRDRAGINLHGVDLGANEGDAEDGLFSPKLSVIYAPDDHWEAYVSAGRGFHSNDARGTTAAVDPVTGEAVAAVNPLVKSRGAEAGLRWFPGDHLHASLAAWWLELDSELLYVGDAGTTEATRASRRHGVEFTAYYRFGEHWTLDLEYAWTRAGFSESAINEGNRIEGALQQVASAGLAADLNGGWFVAARVRYFGPRPLDSFGAVESDSTTVLNLRAGVRIGQAELALDLLNALDADDHDIDYFYASRLPGEPAEGIEDVHYHVMEPRTWRLTASWLF